MYFRGKIQRFVSRFYSRFGWRKFNPDQFEIEHVHFVIPRLSASFNNYCIVHISDLHYGQWLSYSRLAGVVDLINENDPDLVAITGDFVSYLLDESIEGMETELRRLRPHDLTVAVLGNHDHWLGAEKVRRILKSSNICDISNDYYTLRRGSSMLHIAGVDSITVKKDRLDLVLQKMPRKGPAILLAHEPDFAVKSAATKRFNLQLSGHSHGGQLIIPGLGTPFRAYNFKKYPAGMYKVGDMIQYTNRGLGTNSYWLRINCPPEITVISLTCTRT